MIASTGYAGSYDTYHRSTDYRKRTRHGVTMEEIKSWYWEWINNLSINFVPKKLRIICFRKGRSDKEKDFG